MDSTNINRLKNTQASFTGKAQEVQKTQQNQQTKQTKDTKTIQQEIKQKEAQTQEEQKLQEQRQKEQVQQSQTSRINLLRNQQLAQKQTQQAPLYKQELQTLKGVLRNWVNGILNPSSNFNLIQNQNLNENATQRFVNSWLNSDSRTIANLERLLTLQLQLQPNNAEIYVKLQLVKLVKDAKKMVEEYADRSEPKFSSKEAEENQHSILTAGMMATSLNKLRRKKNKSYTDIREEIKKELGTESINEHKSYYENVSRARKLLKEAERELFEAIKNGADQETINQIIEKVSDIYALLSELYKK